MNTLTPPPLGTPLTALDETNVLWNGSEEDGNVRSECEEDAGTDCEDGVYKE